MSYAEFSSLPDAKKDYALLQYTILEDCETDSSPVITEGKTLKKMAEQKQAAFTLLDFTPDKAVFEIEVPEDAALLSFSVPYDEDWHVLVDGNAARTCKINISLLGAFVEPGRHEITLKYNPRMFKEGAGISIAVLLLLWLIRKNLSGWFEAAEAIGNKAAQLIGAKAGGN